MEYWGNKDILTLSKTVFLCSQRCPAEVVLKSFDWAKKQREAGNCIICGNHSQMEKDVFEILLKGKQPLILFLARGMKSRWELQIEKAVKDNRLLVISPFAKEIKRITRKTAEKRNEKMIDMSDKVAAGFITPNGQLDKLLEEGNYELL